MKRFFDLQRFVEEFYNDSPNQTLNGTKSADYFENSGGIVKIFASGGNDTVKNTGNVITIKSGAGKDTLTGGKGKDIFVHSKGKDIITDYTEGEDTIKLNSALKSSEVSGKNVILTTENGTVTIKNGKDKDISLITKISSSTSSLLAENNFMAADNLSAIVENNLSTADYKISTQNFENLTQENKLITFSEK